MIGFSLAQLNVKNQFHSIIFLVRTLHYVIINNNTISICLNNVVKNVVQAGESYADLLIKNGRYGVYIAYKGKNYRIPKGRKVEDLSYEDCLKIIDGSKK